jgi:hypothetical protein
MTVAVLRKELVELTGDAVSALILNQLMFCSEQCSRLGGWFYKAASDLSNELHGLASQSTIRRRIRIMVESGLLEEDRGQGHKWDRTIWYRITDKLDALKKFAFRRHAEPSKHSDSSSRHHDDSITKSSLEGSHAAHALPLEHSRAIALVPSLAGAHEGKQTNLQDHPRFRLGAQAQEPPTGTPPAPPHATRATDCASRSYDGKTEGKFFKKSPELLQLQKIVQSLASRKGGDFKSEVKPLPRFTQKLETAIQEVGGYEKATKYLVWAFEKSRGYIANFKWTDFDIYLLLCKGLVKQWRIESGEVKKSGQIGFDDVLSERLIRDEYTFDPEDKEVGW